LADTVRSDTATAQEQAEISITDTGAKHSDLSQIPSIQFTPKIHDARTEHLDIGCFFLRGVIELKGGKKNILDITFDQDMIVPGEPPRASHNFYNSLDFYGASDFFPRVLRVNIAQPLRRIPYEDIISINFSAGLRGNEPDKIKPLPICNPIRV
jgi:hypothetical protein